MGFGRDGAQGFGARAGAQLVVVDDVAQDGVGDDVGQRDAHAEAQAHLLRFGLGLGLGLVANPNPNPNPYPNPS